MSFKIKDMRTRDKKTCGNVKKGKKKTSTSFEEERKKIQFLEGMGGFLG
jgi:hypothetical protein